MRRKSSMRCLREELAGIWRVRLSFFALVFFNCLLYVYLIKTTREAFDTCTANQQQAERKAEYYERQLIDPPKPNIPPSEMQGAPSRNEIPFHLQKILIAISTVPRQSKNSSKDMIDYLTPTLLALLQQLPKSGQIRVLVMNHQPGQHAAFELARLRFSRGTANTTDLHENRIDPDILSFVDFTDNANRRMDPHHSIPDPDDAHNPTDTPGRKVRQQTYDIISLIDEVRLSSTYVVFVEDDFIACDKALDMLPYIILKVYRVSPNWRAIRTSFGFNGIIVQSYHLQSLAAYLEENILRFPPDHLLVKWMCQSQDKPQGESQDEVIPASNFAYRWNLFRHIGSVSSLRNTTVETAAKHIEDIPVCWEAYSSMLWPIDGFNATECKNDDIWPCTYKTDNRAMDRRLKAGTLSPITYPWVNSIPFVGLGRGVTLQVMVNQTLAFEYLADLSMEKYSKWIEFHL